MLPKEAALLYFTIFVLSNLQSEHTCSVYHKNANNSKLDHEYFMSAQKVTFCTN